MITWHAADKFNWKCSQNICKVFPAKFKIPLILKYSSRRPYISHWMNIRAWSIVIPEKFIYSSFHNMRGLFIYSLIFICLFICLICCLAAHWRNPVLGIGYMIVQVNTVGILRGKIIARNPSRIRCVCVVCVKHTVDRSNKDKRIQLCFC